MSLSIDDLGGSGEAHELEVSIIMPCLNEAETLASCIAKATQWAKASGYSFEIVVADNGSTDESIAIATRLGARVVHVVERGYGAALWTGLASAGGRWLIMGDADDSYDFSNLTPFLRELEAGNDVVIGNRFQGGIARGAMPWKNRYVGNPILSWVGRRLFRVDVGDWHCGLRAITSRKFRELDLRTSGMEFASEMVIRSALTDARLSEVPTTLSVDGRSRQPHLKPWRDGWRHLRFMLLMSPRWLFIIPGMFVLALSTALYVPLLLQPLHIASVVLDLRAMWISASFMVLGYLLLLMGSVVRRLGRNDELFGPVESERIPSSKAMSLEISALIGVLCMIGGLASAIVVVRDWGQVGFGNLYDRTTLALVSLSSTLLMLGGITLVFSLINGFLDLPLRRSSLDGSTSSFTDTNKNLGG